MDLGVLAVESDLENERATFCPGIELMAQDIDVIYNTPQQLMMVKLSKKKRNPSQE